MCKFKNLLFISSLIILLSSCNKFDGKISYRDASNFWCYQGTLYEQQGLYDSKKVFLMNTSSNKKLQFTLKITTKIYDCDYKTQEPKIETGKTHTEQLFKTLEPGEEKELGYNKYKIKDAVWDENGRGFYDPSKHFHTYYEIDYEIVGAREDN